jgi:hypothetical protein
VHYDPSNVLILRIKAGRGIKTQTINESIIRVRALFWENGEKNKGNIKEG